LRSSLIRRLLLTVTLCLTLSAQAETKTGEAEELKDLHYGEALYQLYQENYFQAIVHLLAARKRGLMEAYEDEPELLLGGLYLAYGMPDTAESLFQRVLDRSATPELKSRAWLQLAKARHRRSDHTAAKDALTRVGDGLEEPARDESINLMGLLQMLDADNPAAAETLAELSPQSDWSYYGEFNRAIALLRAGDMSQGTELLEELGKRKADSNENRSIRDRANLVLGYLQLETEQPEQALEALQRIRLTGPASSQALLGAGWAYLKMDQPTQALVPWQTLAKRTANEPAVLEVQLAIPYALAQLEAEQQSLQGYQDAIARYNTAIQDVDGVIAQVQQSNFPNLLLASSETTETSPELQALKAQLPILLSKNEFIERLQDYRDLRQLERNLNQWQEKVVSYRSMLAVQLESYAKRSPEVDAYLNGNTSKQMEKERDALQDQYARAASPKEPPFILTTADEKGWLARLDRVEALIDKYGAGDRLATQREIARLMRGILIWRTVTEHPQRVWSLKKEMTELDQTLENTRKLEAELAQTRQETKGRFKNYAKRIEALEGDIPARLERVRQLRSAERKHLQRMAVETLEQRKTLLHDYLIQARFGVASLLDRSTAKATEGTAQ
jgi:outer membrane protein assembly factor BamD (BamD/ComL family)